MIHKEFCFTSLDHWKMPYAAIISYPDNYNPSRSEKYPVFFFFHGLGEIGNGATAFNLSLLKSNLALYARINNGSLNWTDAIFVQPQIPKGQAVWDILFLREFVEVILGIRPVPSTYQPSNAIDGITPLDGYKAYNIDRNKIHLAGVSLGGYAITRLVASNHFADDFFCSVLHLAAVNNDVNTPAKARKVRYFWGRHNQDDKQVYPDAIDAWVNNLNVGGRLVQMNVIKPVSGGHTGWNNYLNQSNQSDLTSPYNFAFSKSRLDYTSVDNNVGVPAPEPVVPPQIATLIPSDNSTGVLVTTNHLTIIFSKNVVIGTGNIVLNNSTDGTAQNIALSAVTLVNATVTIPVTLLAGKAYNIQIPTTAFKDVDNTPFAGILNSSTWNFSVLAAVGSGPEGKIVATITLNKAATNAEVINKFGKNKYVSIQFDDNNPRAKDALIVAQARTLTDGCGLNIPYRFSVAVNGHSSYNGGELGGNANYGKLIYSEYGPLITAGIDVENHSDKHEPVASLDVAKSDIIINQDLHANEIKYVMNASVVPTNFSYYTKAWKELYYLTTSTQGAKDSLPIYPDPEAWSLPVWQRQIGDLNDIPEGFAQLQRSFTEAWSTANVTTLKALIDTLIDNSDDDTNLFLIIGTHGYNATNFADFLDHLDDSFLVASVREIFEYKILKENAVSVVSQTISGNQLIVTYDYDKMPNQIRWKDLSFELPDGYTIQSMTVTGADNFSFSGRKFNLYKQKLQWTNTLLEPLVFVDEASLPKATAPTDFIVNDKTNTAGFTNTGDKTNADTEITFDGGITWKNNSDNPFNVGNIDAPIGRIGVRYRSVKNTSRASDTLFNQVKYNISSNVLDRIPIDNNRVFSTSNTAMSGLAFLSDGLTPTERPGIGYSILVNPVEFWYDLDPDMGAAIKKFRLYDGQGSFTATPFKVFAVDIVNNAIQKILLFSFNGAGFNVWREYELETSIQPRYLVFEATYTGGAFDAPTELEILGYINEGYVAPIITPEVNRNKLRYLLGNPNIFVWNAMQNAANPSDVKFVKPEKYNQIKQFNFSRIYIDWYELEHQEGKYSYQPTLRSGWYYDNLFQKMKEDGHTTLFSIQSLPDWMNAKYAPADRDHENLPKDPFAEGSDPNSWKELSEFCFQVAARYGDTVVDTSLLSVDTSARFPGADINTVKTGLGYIKYFSPFNEIDKTWKLAKAYLKPWDWGPFMSAMYDGHKGTMGNNVGFKTADPTCKVSIPGLAAARPDVLFFINLWSMIHRGFKLDGSVDLPFDIIDYHQYQNDGGSSQYGTATRGVAPELGAFKRDLTKIKYCKQYILKQDKEIWLTETGYDIKQSSPQKAIVIGSRSVLQTQADWSLRQALLAAELGVNRLNVYQWEDDNLASDLTYRSSGIVDKANGYVNKPVANYLKSTLDEFGEFTYAETLSENPRVRRYENTDGESMWDIVSPTEIGTTGNYPFTMPYGINSIRLFVPKDNAIDFTESVLTPSSGRVVPIPYSETPQFFTAIEGEVVFKGLSIIARRIPI